ncbi:NAD(+) diphosphatase [Psychromonas antarctica]|jgi:NAD+ diphosphatase|uniref:NAD(+) diphosphatase n=1 Tax=Psychromonas antarctica TaxID=67573 RepID=UPI001EE92133|nr:NAD(+) diphosphatase [Psychromonas antarctica]MCG6200178.1 NAD(+) diphosphatase [Psychromonas antarctica]
MTLAAQNINNQEDAWWFIVAQGEIVLQPQGDFIPYGNLDDLPFSASLIGNKIKIGEYHSSPCYLVQLAEKIDVGLGEYSSLRFLLGRVEDSLFDMAGRAFQISLFFQTHQYCGQCGEKMRAIDWEIAMKCYHCQHRCYPRVSPCAIVGIRKDKQILLALHRRHQQDNRPVFTILAGFTEAGETVENCVEREVYEEAGIKIKNIQYVTSQPWPFPHSLMMGYTAEYQSGKINIDPKELCSAAWYEIDDLPVLPNPGTLARKLIDQLIIECR